MKRGRPKGSVKAGSRWVKRKEWEITSLLQPTTIRIDARVYEALKIHAFKRHTKSVGLLITDLLTLWVNAATDLKQEVWKEFFPLGENFPDIPERFPGYLASLGFAPAVRQHDVSLTPPDVQRPPDEPPKEIRL